MLLQILFIRSVFPYGFAYLVSGFAICLIGSDVMLIRLFLLISERMLIGGAIIYWLIFTLRIQKGNFFFFPSLCRTMIIRSMD